MKKRLVPFLLTIVLATGTLAGCGGDVNSESSSQPPANEESTDIPKANEPEPTKLSGSLISEEPVTFSIFLSFNNMPFNSEWAIWQEIAKRTNVSFEGVIAQSNSNETEAFNLMVSSGELADVIGYVDSSELEKLGRDGGMLPLNDLIDEHAPNIKQYLETDSDFRKAAYSLDGNIYQIPKNQELLFAEMWWIRKDWLDKLDLQVPDTVDDLYDVLTAFRNNDPNGNGIKDEIPLFDRAGHKMPDEYLYLWDTSTEFYARDGKIEFEPLEDNFKTGVKNIVQWYDEGLIDPEIFTRGPKSRDILFSGDLGGVTHDWVSTANYNDNLPDEIPGFEIVGFAPPKNQNGNRIERTTRYPGVGWGISTQAKDPVTIIKFMDYMFCEEGYTLMNWGIEGETYTVNSSGDKEFMDVVMNSEQTPLGYLRSLGIQYRIGMRQDGRYEYAFMSDAAYEAALLYDSNPDWFLPDLPPYLDGTLGLKYTPENENEYKKIMSNIRPYVDEKFQSWLLGTADFESEYDDFVTELKSRGIDRAIEINQESYDIYIGK